MQNDRINTMEENYKVLIIDDDELIAKSTAEYFNMFDVKTAKITICPSSSSVPEPVMTMS